MKTCTSCQSTLSLSCFSRQKTNPAKLYAWCDDCRKMNLPKCSIKPKGSFMSEMQILKEQALRNRKFDDAAAAALLKERETYTIKELAERHGVSKETIRTTLKRADGPR